MLALAIEGVENRWFSRGFRAYSSVLVQCYSEALFEPRRVAIDVQVHDPARPAAVDDPSEFPE